MRKPIVQMSGEEFFFLIREGTSTSSQSPNKSGSEKYVYGIKGIADLGVTLSQKTVRVNNGYYSQYVYMPYVYAAASSSPLKSGDLIYKVGDTLLSTTDGTSLSLLKRIVRTYTVGQTIELTIYRDDQLITVSVTLVEYVPT